MALSFLVLLAIAAPVLGHDSRVASVDRPVRWWPADARLDAVPRLDARTVPHVRAHRPSAGRKSPEARAA